MATKKKPAKKARKAPAKAAKPRQQTATSARSKRDRRIDVFAIEYIANNFNGRRAAIAAGFSPESARFEASRLLTDPVVEAKVEEAMAARLARAGLDADQVLARIRAIATADANELIELRRCCCRYCYGRNHRYQRTPAELKKHREEFEKKIDDAEPNAERAAELKDEFDEEGGIGWDPRRDPHANCPECFGEGQLKEFAKDTRELSPEARMLYRGVKVTQNGLQVLTADQDAHLRMLAEHAGLLRKRVELTGKDGGPVRTIGAILDEIDGADTGLPTRHAEEGG